MTREDLNEKVKALEFKLARIQKELKEISERELVVPLDEALNESAAPSNKYCSYVDGSWDGKIVLSKILLAQFF